uniref:(northern house mosquito) hypothetical protein n=1 Tax=Culex pipiens TaxID=7175 RepID=A0A8D8ANL9_CULPI
MIFFCSRSFSKQKQKSKRSNKRTPFFHFPDFLRKLCMCMFLISNNTQIKQIAKFLDSKLKTDFGLGASPSPRTFSSQIWRGKTNKKKQNFQARAKTQTKTKQV